MEMIRDDVFRKQLKKGLSGGFLFFGDEDYMKSFALRSARQAICPDPTFSLFNDLRMDSMNFSADALLDALMPLPMMADQKIVTVSGLNIYTLIRNHEFDALIDTLSKLEEYDYNVLILSVPAEQIDVGRFPKKPASEPLKRLSEFLTPVYFEPISGARLVTWVGKHFEHHGVHASPEVCKHLIDLCGQSMFILGSETEKISYYVQSFGRTDVTEADVDTASIAELSTDAFALSNALLDGQHEKALQALDVMKFRRIDPLIVMGEISKSISDMALVKALCTEGLPPAEIGALVGIKSDYKTRLYISACATKSPKKLRRAVELCADADRMLKSSYQGYLAIEQVICTL